jgi:molybdenum cofactor cytidylyltransferase
MNTPKNKISGIILAAGSSSRMGKTKQLMQFGNTSILGRVISSARKSFLHEIIVVLGHDAEKIKQKVDLSHTQTVINSEYLKGQSTSLIKGIENISPQCGSAMFLLADQPLVTADIINSLIETFKNSDAPIVIPYFKEKRGNPVIIGRPLFHRLKSLSADTGARVLFKEYKNSILRKTIDDEAILVDVDTIDDYQKLIV